MLDDGDQRRQHRRVVGQVGVDLRRRSRRRSSIARRNPARYAAPRPALRRAAQHLDVAELVGERVGEVGGAVGAVVVDHQDRRRPASACADRRQQRLEVRRPRCRSARRPPTHDRDSTRSARLRHRDRPPSGPDASSPCRPDDRPLSALPSPAARGAGLRRRSSSAALAGGLIGYSLVELQCTGDCAVAAGLGGVHRRGRRRRRDEHRRRARAAGARRVARDQRPRTATRATVVAPTTLAPSTSATSSPRSPPTLASARRRRSSATAATAWRSPTSTPKSIGTDLVTEYDRAAERLIVGALARARPDDGIDRRGGHLRRRHERRALADRPDRRHDQLLLRPARLHRVDRRRRRRRARSSARCTCPPTDELFTAAPRRRGAGCNGAPIRCTPTDRPRRQALVATGLQLPRPTARAPRAAGSPRCSAGSATSAASARPRLDLCYVAAGRVDAYFEQWLGPWDLAAGELIAAEAGCRIGDLRRRPRATRTDCSWPHPGVFDDLRWRCSTAATDADVAAVASERSPA